MIVTIDGPAGTGKSTVARLLAERLHFDYLDTGAMYRMLAFKSLQDNCALDSMTELLALASTTTMDFHEGHALLDGHPVGTELRTSDVAMAASLVAQIPEIRQILVDRQREIAHRRNIVCEGRDQGTVAFPYAECKFFLTASPDIRAQRRHADLQAQGIEADLEELVQEQLVRDERDEKRSVSPLRPADDAVTIDTTDLQIEEVIQKLIDIVKNRVDERGRAEPS